MNLITGRAGAAHITPRQDAMWHQGLTETESCIFDAYENFAAEIITNNEVRIRSGVGMLQGRFFCIEPNTYDSADIANGNQGEKRIDLIVARITVDASTNTQSASIEVIQGTPAAENPTAPEGTVGDLDAGDLIADYPLVEVLLNGINIESLTPVFDTGWIFNGAGRQKLNLIGENPITSTNDDTPENWVSLGTGIAGYNALGMITDQPSQNGILVNQCYGNSLFQTWCGTDVNGTWHRRGNQNGWQSTWIKQLDENNGIQTKKLWENASPTSAFPAQTIELDLSEYDGVFIVFNTFSNPSYGAVSNKYTPIGNSDYALGLNGGRFTHRTATVNSNSIVFSGAASVPYYNQTNTEASNSSLVPYTIYGIKGVN